MSIRDGCRRRQHRPQQHRTPGRQIIRRGVFDFVVADAAFARYEDHPGRAEFGEEDCVVPCPTDDVHVRQAQPLSSAAYRFDAAFVEVQRREIRSGCQFKGQAVFLAGGFDDFADFGDHRVQTCRFQMTEVQGHAHFARDDVA